MTTPRQPKGTGSFQDPRSSQDFRPRLYPKANGGEAPPADSPDANDRLVLQFLAAYYEINCRYASLREVREQKGSVHDDQREREALQAIEVSLQHRDALEDRYAPHGVIAEPVVKAGFAVDVKFSFGNADATGRPRSDLYKITAYVPIPISAGDKLEDLTVKIEGPGIGPE
jgi:hypothetical protein